MADQTDRIIIKNALADMEARLRELEILYEKYFSKTLKREPIREREDLARRFRQFVNRKIIQTEMNYKYQNLSSRFYSYAQHWDRVVRLIEEGKYFRGRSEALSGEPVTSRAASSMAEAQVDDLYREFLQVRQSCQIKGKAPDRSQLASFLRQQKEKIAQQTGSPEADFSVRVVAENGKPKIKVRIKKK